MQCDIKEDVEVQCDAITQDIIDLDTNEAYAQHGSEDNLEFARSQFNKNRKLIIRNVPPVTYEEIKEFLGEYLVSNIAISKKCRHAIVTLLHGEQAEEAVTQLSQKTLLGSSVEVALLGNENLLCVSQLPFNLTEEEFRNEMQEYGIIEKCFLMKHADTGTSKGYGFVEFVHNKEKSLEACYALDCKNMDSCITQCSFLGSKVVHFEELHSKFLYIEGFPSDYSNEQELKNICSIYGEPSCYKFGQHEEKFLGFAVVAYDNYKIAELTLEQTRCHRVEENILKVSYCKPEEEFTVLYEEFVNRKLNKKKLTESSEDGRIHVPTVKNFNLASPVVKKLLSGNPQALENFIRVLNLLQIQIQEHMQQQQQDTKPSLLGPAPFGPLMNPNMQISLLAVIMAMQIQQSQPGFVGDPVIQQFILSGLQNQQKESQAVLGNPLIVKANSMLQNVINNKDTDDAANANKPSGSNAQDITSCYQVFPGPDKESFDQNTLIDFNHILSALTPESNSNIKARTIRNKITDIGNRSNISNVDRVPSLLDQQKCPSESSQMENENHSLLGPAPGFDNRPGLLGNYPGTRQYMSYENQWNDKEASLASSPFFDIPGVGIANPFLATYIENQIKHHIQQHQITGQKPVSLLDLPLPPPNTTTSETNQNYLFNQQQNWLNQQQFMLQSQNNQFQRDNIMNQNEDHPKPLPLFDVPVPSLNNNFNSYYNNQYPAMRTENDRSSLLGNVPSTPTSRSKPSHLLRSDYVTEKRTLQFEDNRTQLHVPRKMNLDNTSLLGEAPSNLPQIGQVSKPTGSWEGFCKNITQSSAYSDDNFRTTKIPSLLGSYNTNITQDFQATVNNYGENQNEISGRSSSDNFNDLSSLHYNKLDSNEMNQSTNNKSYMSTPTSLLDLNIQPPEALLSPQQNQFTRTGLTNKMIHQPLTMGYTNKSVDQISMPPPNVLPLMSSFNRNTTQFSNSITTPHQAVKRKIPHLLPSPESSPDGVYVGQHSQGLGGHYAETFFNKKFKHF